MELIESFTNRRIFLDTAPLIYYIEDSAYFSKSLSELFIAVEEQKCVLISSVITLAEVLVLPLREGRQDLVEKYESILTNSQSVIIADINLEIAKITAQLRAKYSLKTPDAIQIGAAIFHSADYFLTNDKRLKSIKEVNVITLDDF
jgi:predicted nucleic acid-binding protein